MKDLLKELDKFSPVFIKTTEKQKNKIIKDNSLDLLSFEFTKRKLVKKIYCLYLKGYSTQDIRIITELETEVIDNIIDCCNYLNN